jgi:AbrB family looped-hinge helix DNA binding protein
MRSLLVPYWENAFSISLSDRIAHRPRSLDSRTAIPISNAIFAGEVVSMETTVSIDRAGRIVLPKKIRDELQFSAGDELSLISDGGHVTLRPTRSASRMRKVLGMWVFST